MHIFLGERRWIVRFVFLSSKIGEVLSVFFLLFTNTDENYLLKNGETENVKKSQITSINNIKTYNNFKQRTFAHACREINDNYNMGLGFEELKCGVSILSNFKL